MDSVYNEETSDPAAEGKSRQQFPGVAKLRVVFQPDWGMMGGGGLISSSGLNVVLLKTQMMTFHPKILSPQKVTLLGDRLVADVKLE